MEAPETQETSEALSALVVSGDGLTGLAVAGLAGLCRGRWHLPAVYLMIVGFVAQG